MKNQVYFPFSQSFVAGERDNNTMTTDGNTTDEDMRALKEISFPVVRPSIIQQQQPSIIMINQSPLQQSTPLILAMNRLQNQSKSQMRKFGRLNEIPGAWLTQQELLLQQIIQNSPYQQPQQRPPQQYSDFDRSPNQQFNHHQQKQMTQEQQHNQQLMQQYQQRPANNPAIFRPINNEVPFTKKKGSSKRKIKKQLKTINYGDEPNHGGLDDDERLWLQQFGNKNQHNNNMMSENESSHYGRHFSRQENISGRKHNSIEPVSYLSNNETQESEQQKPFMSKRSRQMLSRNLQNNNSAFAHYNNNQHRTDEVVQYLPPLRQQNNRSTLDYYTGEQQSSIMQAQSDGKQNRRNNNQHVESSGNFQSQASTKLSEFKQSNQLKALGNQVDSTYGLTEIKKAARESNERSRAAGIKYSQNFESNTLQPPPAIPLGIGLAQKRASQQQLLKVRSGIEDSRRQPSDLQSQITFREHEERNKILMPTIASKQKRRQLIAQSTDNMQRTPKTQEPKISMFNMQIDHNVLEQLQSGQLTDTQKHELIYEILKAQSEKIGGHSSSPEQDLPMTDQAKQSISALIKGGRHQRSKEQFVDNNRLEGGNLQIYRKQEKSQKKKSFSPPRENPEAINKIVNNLTSHRHVNKYCRHCFIKALQEEQKTKKNHMVIYDANNCRKFIKKIKNMNKKMHSQHRKATLSLQNNLVNTSSHGIGNLIKRSRLNLHAVDSSMNSSNHDSARMKNQQRKSHNVNALDSMQMGNLNRSAESMVHLKYMGNDALAKGANPRPSSNRGGNHYSTYTLGGRANQQQERKNSSIQAGNHTIDIIRKSTTTHSQLESAKFLSHVESPRHQEGKEKLKTIEISLAPDVITEFQRRRATYIIKKTEEAKAKSKSSIEIVKDPSMPRRQTTYYERCKQRREYLYGNKSQVIIRTPTPPIEFDGPFLNVEIRVASAPRSVQSVGLSVLEIEYKEIFVQTTQQKFFDAAVETDPPPPPYESSEEEVIEQVLEINIDLAVQTDQTCQWFLNRAAQKTYQTFNEQEKTTRQQQQNKTHTSDKSVQAQTKPKFNITQHENETGNTANLMHHYFFNLSSVATQVEIEQEEQKAEEERQRLERERLRLEQELEMERLRLEREREQERLRLEQERERERLRLEKEAMLRNAVQIVSGQLDPRNGIIKMKAEFNEQFPSKNYDWSKSGLYQQILKIHQQEKVNGVSLRDRSPKQSKFTNHGYRMALGIVITGNGDQHEVHSVENSQDASSNINTQKELQEQIEDLQNLNPENHEIFTELEIIYIAVLLKKKAPSVSSPDQIDNIFQKAITTLTVLTTNLIQGETSLDNILHHYQDPIRLNVIRLLVRCKRMYDARVDIKKILHSLITVQDMIDTLTIKRNAAVEAQCLTQLNRLLSQLSTFKEENKLFSKKFIFNEVDMYQYIEELEDSLISGDFYIQNKLKKMEQQVLLKLNPTSKSVKVQEIQTSEDLNIIIPPPHDIVIVKKLEPVISKPPEEVKTPAIISTKSNLKTQVKFTDQAIETMEVHPIMVQAMMMQTSPQSKKVVTIAHSVGVKSEENMPRPKYQDNMKIYEQKKHASVAVESDDDDASSSKQLTLILSQDGDQKIYENRKRSPGQRKVQTTNLLSQDNNIMSMMETPRVERDKFIIQHLKQRGSELNVQQDFTQTNYSLKTVQVKAGQTPNSHQDGSIGGQQVLNGSLYSENRQSKSSKKNLTQQNWRYNEAGSVKHSHEYDDQPAIISIQEQRKSVTRQ